MNKQGSGERIDAQLQPRDLLFIYLCTDPVASVFKGNVILGVNGSHGQSEILLSGNDAHFPPIHRLFGSYIRKKIQLERNILENGIENDYLECLFYGCRGLPRIPVTGRVSSCEPTSTSSSCSTYCMIDIERVSLVWKNTHVISPVDWTV